MKKFLLVSDSNIVQCITHMFAVMLIEANLLFRLLYEDLAHKVVCNIQYLIINNCVLAYTFTTFLSLFLSINSKPYILSKYAVRQYGVL